MFPSSPLLTLSPPVEVAVLEAGVVSEVPGTTAIPVSELEVVSEVSTVEDATITGTVVDAASDVEGTGTITTGAEELGTCSEVLEATA